MLSLRGQAFPCLDQFFITLNESAAPSQLFQITTNGTTVDFDPNFSVPYWVNAIGFNPLDRHIYGIRLGSDEILRINANGDVDVVGTGTGIGGDWVAVAGDCSPTGKFVVNHRRDNRLYFFNVVGTFAQEQAVDLRWHPSSGNVGVVDVLLDDLVFDPFQPNTIYTYQRATWPGEPFLTRNHLLRIDADPNSPTFGNVFSVGEVTPGVIVQIGALFFNSKGELFGYGSTTGPPYTQRQLVKIDKRNGESSRIAVGPQAEGNDGCSCPYTIVATKEVETVIPLCEEAIVEYQITIINRGLEDISTMTFRDILPAQARVVEVFPRDPFGVTPAAGTGVGTNELVYTGIDLARSDSISFRLSVSVPLALGTLSNQFVLEALPSLLGSTIRSDDPSTVLLFRDPTITELPAEGGEVAEQRETATICAGETYFWENIELTEPGSYEALRESPDPTACDTLFVLDLSVVEAITLQEDVSLCPNESYTYRDSTFTEAGVYNLRLAGEAGQCDTSLTLNLVPALAGRRDTTVCLLEGGSFVYDNLTITAAGQYEYVLPIANYLGCDSILRINAEIIADGSPFFVPNAFSPGIADGNNDRLQIFPGPAAVRLNRFLIFSRWGGMVYELYDQTFSQPLDTWDGRRKGKLVEQDVFTFLIEVELKDGTIQREVGSMVLF